MCFEADTCVSAYFNAKVSQEVRTISKENKINEEIRDRELRVIDDEGKMLGVMSRDAALALAEEKKLDLVNISPNANPPVCKNSRLWKVQIRNPEERKRSKKKSRRPFR